MKTVILQKLENITNCLSRIESKIPFTQEQLKTNFDLQDTITVNLQRAIQASIDLANHIASESNARTPKDMADSFIVLHELGLLDLQICNQLVKATGFRNVLVHEYDGIDWNIVFNIATQHLDLFKNFMRIIVDKYLS